MVILPFYRFLIGMKEKAETLYAFVTPTGRTVPADIPVRFPSFNRESRMIYGLWDFHGKSVIGRTTLQPPYSGFSALFSLSDKTVSHIEISPDGQKIAFLATDAATGETQLRVIAREEFGWFPLPFIRLSAAYSPICFVSSCIVMYTAPSGALNAVRLTKPAKTAQLFPNGERPAYCHKTGVRAFIDNGRFLLYGRTNEEIDTTNPGAFSFSNEGDALFIAEESTLYRYDLSTKEVTVVFEAPLPINFIAEL